MKKLSTEAAKAKYQYNKKYVDGYWEKKGAAQKEQADDNPVSVSRSDKTDERYIKALETSNKTLNSENRRLIRLLHNYQSIINQSAVAAL